LPEPLPDYSSRSRIRERYGLDVFQSFFEAVVEQSLAAGLVWGKELYLDATKVAANAALIAYDPRSRWPQPCSTTLACQRDSTIIPMFCRDRIDPPLMRLSAW
jgi:hypothetical protein